MKGLMALIASLLCMNIIWGHLTSGKVVSGGVQRSAFQLSATSAPLTEERITENLNGMKLMDLKDLLKKMGGKPGTMRKAELVDLCSSMLLEKASAIQAAAAVREPATTPAPAGTTRIRGLAPVPIDGDTARADDRFDSNVGGNPEGSDQRSYRDFDFPTGADRDNRLEDVGGTDMDMTFLGTASCIPSITRGVSCIAFRFNGDLWLFDCGEASQIQIQKSRVKASKITKIFLTHAHGDHSFGLPGVLCLMGQSTLDERGKADNIGQPLDPIDIYGPEGTRDLVRAMVQLTYSRVVPPYRIHELKSVPFLHYKSYQPPTPVVRTRMDSRFGEVNGGRDIYPDEHGHYHLFDEGELRVQAAPMQHTVPCVGYVVAEKARAGRLRVQECQSVRERNRVALREECGMRDPNKVLATLKALKQGEEFTFPDGTVLRGADIVEPPRRGRKVVIMGDTCSGDAIAGLAKDATLLVHEATNAWLSEHDKPKYGTYRNMERDAVLHGHSTPQMAGAFAKRIKAERLVLTHFSPRYRGDDADFSMKTMWRIEDTARRAAGGMWGRNDVIAAWDHMELPVKVTLALALTLTVTLTLTLTP